MTITITEEEYEAISFAATQLESEIESALDENFLNNAKNSLSALYRIMEKYKKAKYKAREFQSVRALVAEKNRGRCIMARDIDRMTRKFMRYLKEKGEL